MADPAQSYNYTTIFVQVVRQILPHITFSGWSIVTEDRSIYRLTRGCHIIIMRGSDNCRLGAIFLLQISSRRANYSRSNLRLTLTIYSADGRERSG
jgi:hypothetical protein